jgi:WhiB family redox-sensing transcriptional regulator
LLAFLTTFVFYWKAQTQAAQEGGIPMAVQQLWQEEAACQSEDPELFFPLGEYGDGNAAQIAQAKAICFGCPVASSCLDWALRGKIPHGIFGGLTPSERKKLRLRLEMEQTVLTAV